MTSFFGVVHGCGLRNFGVICPCDDTSPLLGVGEDLGICRTVVELLVVLPVGHSTDEDSRALVVDLLVVGVAAVVVPASTTRLMQNNKVTEPVFDTFELRRNI